MELTTKKCAHNDQKTVSNIWGQGGGIHNLFLKRIDYLEKQHKILEKN